MTKWKIIDAQEMHRQHPDTFGGPTPAELDLIEVGDIVKIGFAGPDGGERFWVEVLGFKGSGFSGRVDNELYHVDKHGLDANDWVFFECRHVLDIA